MFLAENANSTRFVLVGGESHGVGVQEPKITRSLVPCSAAETLAGQSIFSSARANVRLVSGFARYQRIQTVWNKTHSMPC